MAAVSLTLCGAVCVLWFRSYRSQDWVMWRTASGVKWKISSVVGTLVIERAIWPIPSDDAGIWADAWALAADIDRADAVGYRDVDTVAGFGIGGGEHQTTDPSEVVAHGESYTMLDVPFTVVILPIQAVVVVTAMMPTYVAVRYGRRAHRSRAGRCPACGYDLRATPERCPECGAVPAPPAPAA
jgi:hypothetical protein